MNNTHRNTRDRPGILSFGAYVPRLRLQREAVVAANAWFNPAIRAYGTGERSMCNWDEDSLTMAVEAARDCLGPDRPEDLRTIYLSSTTHPYQDRQNAGILATALNLSDNVATIDLTGSQRIGTSGLTTALRAISGRDGSALLVATDKRRTKAGGAHELLYGDGAAALHVGTGDVVAEVIGMQQMSTDFVDHFRGQGKSFDYNWEDRWIREEGYLDLVPRILDRLFSSLEEDVHPDQINHFAMPCVFRGVTSRIAKRVGIPEQAVRDSLHEQMGESGTAHSLVMMVDALQEAKPGETILVMGWGQGCDALLFRTTARVLERQPRVGLKGWLARRKPESNYNRFLAFNDLVIMDRGLRSEFSPSPALTAHYRHRDMILGMIGGRCTVCETAQFPKSMSCVNPNCGALHSQEDFPFSEVPARIQSWTADNLTYTPDPPMYFGMVVFEEGGRLMADLTDVDESDVEVGAPMRMVFRIKQHDEERGLTRYFWKATPDPLQTLQSTI